MTDIPIIFSAPMVLAHLAARKTMTRRMRWRGAKAADGDGFSLSPWSRVKAGDRLWVREAWAGYLEKVPEGTCPWACYRATDEADFLPGMKWKPSIHMPRWASRLTLIVSETKIERLQNITEADAYREGVEKRGERDYWAGQNRGTDAVACFSALWLSLHGMGSWNQNPEVVAISYRVIKANIDSPEARAA